MSITNLSSRQWYNNYMLTELNAALDQCTGTVYSLNFVANHITYGSITLNNDSIYYDDTKVYEKTNNAWGGAWVTDLYAFITITGGTDAVNPTLIGFFTSAGVLSNVTSLSLDLGTVGFPDGTYTLKVKAIGDDSTHIDSDMSNSVSYTYVTPTYRVSIAEISSDMTIFKYSVNNGTSWADVTGTGLIGKFTQIKFMYKGSAALVFNSPTLRPDPPHSLTIGSAGTTTMTPNITLTRDVTDIRLINKN